ncbi:unnamed protein product [Thlaspi arvense]|uniref:DUF1216 domain-containing protein n=1 Tax=Thlaspi arvense TaxID=13288 RepID=A0AAU9RPG8_THLAR|nr:unnamed protein product [Thlaspi arvense]
MARTSSAVCLLLLVALSAVYEVQGTFLFRHYMRKFPRRSRDFGPFACNGMLKFVDVLELKCPLKPEYKNFFGKLRSYMGFINSASGSATFDTDLKGKAEGLHTAMSALGGKGGSSADTSNVINVLLSMGKTLSAQKRSGSTEMSFSQRKELIMSMAKWARVISQFVASAASKSGTSIDVSSLGIDGVDASVAIEAGGSPTSGGSPSTAGTGGYGTGASGPTTSSSTQSTNSGSGTTYEGSVNYQSGEKSSQQTVTGSY